MSPDFVNPPPAIALINYPISIGVALAVALTAVLLIVAGRFDPTQGVLTLSIMITLGMLGATAYCLIFTIPQDDITPGVVGALSAGFGAVVAHWLGRIQGPEK
jgi:uncharacterized RDD family membrane protein YckC